jgi:serine/threonine protein kinase
METEEALGIFVQICVAIKYIHEKKILHRDLKTKNVFLDKPPRPGHIPVVKLGDFGIAKVLDCTKAYAKTQIGSASSTGAQPCGHTPSHLSRTTAALLGQRHTTSPPRFARTDPTPTVPTAGPWA